HQETGPVAAGAAAPGTASRRGSRAAPTASATRPAIGTRNITTSSTTSALSVARPGPKTMLGTSISIPMIGVESSPEPASTAISSGRVATLPAPAFCTVFSFTSMMMSSTSAARASTMMPSSATALATSQAKNTSPPWNIDPSEDPLSSAPHRPNPKVVSTGTSRSSSRAPPTPAPQKPRRRMLRACSSMETVGGRYTPLTLAEPGQAPGLRPRSSGPRGSAARDDVHQLRRPHDHLAHRGPVQCPLHPRRCQGRLAQLLLRGVRGDLQPVAHLALDLHHAGDGLGDQQRRVGLRE